MTWNSIDELRMPYGVLVPASILRHYYVMGKMITVKFAIQQPTPKRDKNGAMLPGPTIDETAVLDWVHEQLQPNVEREFGADVELRVVPGRTLDVRLDGTFVQAPKDVKNTVGKLLGLVMEEFDAEPFVREPEL